MLDGQSGTGKTYTMGSSIDTISLDTNLNPNLNPYSDLRNQKNNNLNNNKQTLASFSQEFSKSEYNDEGIIPRAIRYIFHLISNYNRNNIINEINEINNNNNDINNLEEEILQTANKQNRNLDKISNIIANSTINVRISFIEISNEECSDLLHSEIPSRDIMLREDKDGKIFFTGAREEIVYNVEDVLQYLHRGCLHRTTGDTNMNQASSRSHAIFSINIEMVKCQPKSTENHSRESGRSQQTQTSSRGGNSNTNTNAPTTSIITSKLHLVDLAGSERAKRTLASGKRLKESVGINQGLMSLGKVIRALTALSAQDTNVQSNTMNIHIPYRESKLTRFLQVILSLLC